MKRERTFRPKPHFLAYLARIILIGLLATVGGRLVGTVYGIAGGLHYYFTDGAAGSEDAGWVVAMIVIGFTTFVVSSIFVKGGWFAKYVRLSFSSRDQRRDHLRS